jgi:hypothetical protein
LGVALVIALLGQPSSLAQALDRFELVWWLMIAGGLLSSLLALPLRTTPIAVTSPRVALDLEQAAS